MLSGSSERSSVQTNRRQPTTLTLAHSSCSVMLWWLAELDLAPKLNKCGLSSGGIRLRTHLSTASVCNDTCRKHVCMDLREKPKCHFWGFQQAVLGTLKHFKDSRFLSEEVWTRHPCLRSPDILFIAYRHKDLAEFFYIVRFLFSPHP